MSRILLALAVVLVADPASAAPAIKQVAYVGIHPLPDHEFCEIEGPHVHVQAPEQATALYVVIEGRYRFIGDPVVHGYKGKTFPYHGHHVIVGQTFCYIDGAHHHHDAPLPGKFTLQGGFFVFIGIVPARVYVHHHHHHHHHKKHKKHHHHHHDDD
jgi:hypothetical protein